MEAVHYYDGYVSQSMGDGIFALFGAPIACEDHPQRAIFAALRMQEEGKRYAEVLRREKGVNVQIRVGLNTGEVVVRAIHKDNLHTDYTPVGYATSLAARMESLATPGSIIISAHTHQLVEGYFECQSLGPARIKGVSEPLPIYEVLGPGPLRTRLQVAARRGLARFIGRQEEWRQLKQALEQTKSGRGCVVGVRGAPGVGKSRLFHEFKANAASGCLVLEAFSVSHGKAYAYLPLIELLKGYFQITVHDDERRRREKITGKVLTLDRGLEDTLPYLFALLGVEETDFPLQQLDSQIRRRRTFGAVMRLLFQESLNQPLILICEDLHWIDEETQAFLLSQTEQISSTRILLLVNFRPEYQNQWLGKPYYTHIQLEPLGRRDAEELLSLLLGEPEGFTQEHALLQLKQQILEKTDGGHDLGVSSSVWRALALWQLGYPDQAVLSIHEALPLLETLAHPYSTVHTLSFAAVLHQFLRQERAVHERVAAALLLSQEQRFTQYVAMQIILHGWVLTEQGQEEKGIRRINEGLTIWRETHAELFLPYYQALLAEAYGRVGREDEGIAVLDEALASVHNSEEKWWEAELYRLKGELLLKSCGKREMTDKVELRTHG